MEHEPQAGLRARRKLETQREIHQAALELFEAHGVRETTVHQIAEQQSIRHAAGSQHHVQQGDAHHYQLVPAGYLCQPPQGTFLLLHSSICPTHALGETPP